MEKLSVRLILVLFIFISFTYNVSAQYSSKGTIEFSGEVSYTSTTIVTNGTAADQSTSIFSFIPYAGYFISDGFSIGLSPGVNIIKIAGVSESVSNLMLFAVPAYVFNAGNFYPYISAWFGYSSMYSKSDPTSGSGDIDLSGFSYGGRAGIKVPLGKSGLLNTGVSYMLYNFSPKNADKRSGMDVLGITFGVSIYLN